jgi:Zn-dependent protease with chaperone function
MHLYCFLVVVVSLSCGSLPPSDVDPVRATLASLAMVSGWVLLCHVGSRVIARGVKTEGIDERLAADWLDKQLDAFRWLGLGVAVLCLGGFGLARNLDTLPILEHSMFLQALVLLTPAIMTTIGTWSAEHRYGVLLEYTEHGIRNHVRSVWLSLRGSMAWLIAPILILLAAGDLLSILPFETETTTWLTGALVVLFIPLGLPWLMRHLFKTTSLDPSTDHWIAQLMNASGLRRTTAVRWDTGGRNFNAMVAGFVPPLRTLLISDRLVDELPRQQIAMVVLHEAAHLRRRHVPLRMLSVLPAWAAGAAVTRLAGDVSWAVPTGTAIGIALTMLILRLVAYRTEYDADVTACRMAAELSPHVDDVPASYDLAAASLAAALQRVTSDQPASRKATWLHPGVVDRVDWMRRQRDTPNTSSSEAGTIANPA